MSKRGPLLNARIKATGEIVPLMKEPEGTLFHDMYADYRRNNYYTSDEIESVKVFEPLKIELSEKETIAYEDFCKKHSHPGVNFGAIGGHIHLILTGNGLGWGKSCECGYCKERENITDYNTW